MGAKRIGRWSAWIRALSAAVSLLLAVWCAVAWWQSEIFFKAGDAGWAQRTLAHRVLVVAGLWTMRLMVPAILLFGLVVLLVTVVLFVTGRRVLTDAEVDLVKRDLQAWLTYAWGVTAGQVLCFAAFSWFRSLVIMAALPLSIGGAVAYAGSFHRALQVQRYRHQAGLTRVSPSWFLVIATVLLCGGGTLPLGLLALTYVYRAAKAEGPLAHATSA
jgi:hypothetical protein